MLIKAKQILLRFIIIAIATSCSNNSGNKLVESEVVEDSASKQAIQFQSDTSESVTFSKKAIADIYSLAIADFIKSAYKNDKTTFDTLYFGKRVNGTSDDFPDIELPKTIEHTEIRLVTPAEGQTKQAERKSLIYINMVGWVEVEKAEFIFVIFSNGGKHQYDYFINYDYNSTSKQYELKSVKFENYSESEG